MTGQRPTVVLQLTDKGRERGACIHIPSGSDAGIDLAAVDYQVIHDKLVKIETQLRVSIPSGYVGLIRERSSYAQKGLIITGGVIDSGYTGTIYVICHNYPFVEMTLMDAVNNGLLDARRDVFAQLIVVPCITNDDLDFAYGDSEFVVREARGSSGFGSTDALPKSKALP